MSETSTLPRSRNPHSIINDRPIFMFLWKWKIATTRAIGLRFYGDRKDPAFTAYQKLRRLKARGFVKYAFVLGDPGARVWTLTRKGFKIILPSIAPLREEGCESENIYHDLLVQAAHLGWHLTCDDESVDGISEQELRRLLPEYYPDWVPKNPLHRPDGYWRTSSGSERQVVALEVELSRKTHSDYRLVSDFYADSGTISRIIWIVESAPFVDRIRSALACNHSEKVRKHFFFLRKDFEREGWSCKCIRGENSGRKLHEILNLDTQNYSETNPILMRYDSFISAILDTKIRCFKSGTSNKSCDTSHLLLSTPLPIQIT